jgi:tRNA-specific 2-thiouridylase
MSRHGRILVAMSGGVDSSVTALMLHEQGFEVIGVTMKTWDYAAGGTGKRVTGCCDLDSINDARNMAVSRGFHHMIIDLREEFGNAIIGNFTGEYMAGRTPNPCVLCNTFIKWEALLKRADMLDCELIATGHYANVRQENGRWVVSKGLDHAKDQSYVLWGLEQRNLARTRFPIGGFRKSEIRQRAVDSGFPELAKKSESYEICFIPDNDYRGFLKRQDPAAFERWPTASWWPRTVACWANTTATPSSPSASARAWASPREAPCTSRRSSRRPTPWCSVPRMTWTSSTHAGCASPNFQKIPVLEGDAETVTKIRYKDKGTPATIRMDGDRVRVAFHHKVAGVAPGQSAVFYQGDDVLGGGFIDRDLPQA